MKYYIIKANELFVLSGIINKKPSYSYKLFDIFFSNNQNIDKSFDIIYLKRNNSLSNVYTEIITGKKFKVMINSISLEGCFVSVDKSCKTCEEDFLRTAHEVKDLKAAVKFFNSLRKSNLFEMYVNYITELFKKIDENKANVLSGLGTLEESVDAKDFLEGVQYDIKCLKK